ncbi:bro [Agrotis segetum granulovirus]|uniref:Bro n=1 Tax=Agrotis segetum granulosis virus TaxID=10464 RepID=A0A023MIF9_GVAS|nr:bro [Agrotis segetum granulovirus]AHN92187.1 bro [Agrotis segetum granulovirus]AKN63425.1 bro [Agrotis segetum granulovirus]
MLLQKVVCASRKEGEGKIAVYVVTGDNQIYYCKETFTQHLKDNVGLIETKYVKRFDQFEDLMFQVNVHIDADAEFINEPGVYQLLLGGGQLGNLETNKDFIDWVFKELLPTVKMTVFFRNNTATIDTVPFNNHLCMDNLIAIIKQRDALVAKKDKQIDAMLNTVQQQLILLSAIRDVNKTRFDQIDSTIAKMGQSVQQKIAELKLLVSQCANQVIEIVDDDEEENQIHLQETQIIPDLHLMDTQIIPSAVAESQEKFINYEEKNENSQPAAESSPSILRSQDSLPPNYEIYNELDKWYEITSQTNLASQMTSRTDNRKFIEKRNKTSSRYGVLLYREDGAAIAAVMGQMHYVLAQMKNKNHIANNLIVLFCVEDPQKHWLLIRQLMLSEGRFIHRMTNRKIYFSTVTEADEFENLIKCKFPEQQIKMIV